MSDESPRLRLAVRNPQTAEDVIEAIVAGMDALTLQAIVPRRVVLTPRAAALLLVWMGGPARQAVGLANVMGLEVRMEDGADDRPLVLP